MTTGDLFLKSLRWSIFITFIIGGIGFFIAVQEGTIKPLMLSLLSFGVAYWMSDSWRGLAAKAMILSILWVMFSALLADRLPNLARNLAGVDIYLNFYIRWIGLSFFPGIPVMMYIFKKHDN